MDESAFHKKVAEMAAQLEPCLADLARKRHGHLLFLFIGIPVITICLVVPAVHFAFSWAGFSLPHLFLAALALGYGFALAAYPGFDYDYRRKAKRMIVYKIADLMRLRYNPNGLFKAGEIYQHYILPLYSIDKNEDGFSFRVGGRRVEMQETVLARFLDSGITDSRMVTAAQRQSLLKNGERGLIIRIESRKKQPFHTVVLPKNSYQHAELQGLRSYERTPFGNPAFSQNFKVLSEDHTDAHDIFDPAFIEKFLAFEQQIGADSLSVSFKDREIVFYARHKHDLFEPGHLLKPAEADAAFQIINDIHALAELIEALKLNPYVGL